LPHLSAAKPPITSVFICRMILASLIFKVQLFDRSGFLRTDFFFSGFFAILHRSSSVWQGTLACIRLSWMTPKDCCLLIQPVFSFFTKFLIRLSLFRRQGGCDLRAPADPCLCVRPNSITVCYPLSKWFPYFDLRPSTLRQGPGMEYLFFARAFFFRDPPHRASATPRPLF